MNLICGINPVLEALAAGTRHFDRLLVVKGLRNRRVSEAIATRQPAWASPCASRRARPSTAWRAACRTRASSPWSRPSRVLSLEQLAGRGARQPALVVVLDGVEDPRNLGRDPAHGEAAGADGVLLPERHSAGLIRDRGPRLGRRPRARAGGPRRQPRRRPSRRSRPGASGWWASTPRAPSAGTRSTSSARSALVLGGEGRGIRRLVREHVRSPRLDPAVRPRRPRSTCRWRRASPSTRRCASAARCRATCGRFPPRAVAAAADRRPGADDTEHDPGARPVARPRPATTARLDEEDHGSR